MERRRLYWRLCYSAVFLLSVLTFTPIVTPAHTYRPTLGGLPYTLWMGLVVTVALVLLTYFATRLYPVQHEPEEDGP